MSKSLFTASGSIKKKIDSFPLNLAYQGLTEIPEDVIHKHAIRTSSLDLSYNNLKYLFLRTEVEKLLYTV